MAIVWLMMLLRNFVQYNPLHIFGYVSGCLNPSNACFGGC